MTSRPPVLVDGRVISHPTAGGRGIGRYTIGLVRAMHESGADVTVMNSTARDQQAWVEAIAGIKVAPMSRDTVRAASPETWFMCTQMMLHPIPLDVVPRMITQAGLRVVGVLLDVIPYRYPERYLVDPSALRQSQLRAILVRTLDVLLADSSFAADTGSQVLKYDRSKIHVVGAAVEPQFVVGESSPKRLARLVSKGFDAARRTVVAVTGGDDRKNTAGLIRAWAELPVDLRQSHQLVIACAAVPIVQDRWHHVAHVCGLAWQSDIVVTDTVTDDEMVALYQRATLSVFPSIEEGFGLPVAEATACGCPTICADNSSLPEVMNCDEALFNAHDVMDMSRVIEWALVDEAYRQRLVAAADRAAQRWTWQRVGHDAVAALDGAMVSNGRRVEMPVRVGLMGPSSGSPSGIGAYNARLVEAWRQQADLPELVTFIDVSNTDLPVGDYCSAAGLDRYWYRHDVDELIVTLGSSPYHAISVERASSTPCHVWLHEPTLVGCHVGIGHQSGSRQWAEQRMRELLIECAVAPDTWPEDLLDAEAYHRAGIHFLEPVLRQAESVIVSSDQAAQKIRDLGVVVPILVLPLAYPRCAAVTAPPSAPVVVSVGWIDDNKRPLDVLRAVATTAARLIFVGEATETQFAELMAAAESLGMADRVTCTGRLPETEYDLILRTASVAIQLRRDGGRGERSAAVNDVLARGIPVISDIGQPSLAVSAIAEQLSSLLFHGDEWRQASMAAATMALSWTSDDVSRALARWIDRSPQFEAATIHHALSLG